MSRSKPGRFARCKTANQGSHGGQDVAIIVHIRGSQGRMWRHTMFDDTLITRWWVTPCILCDIVTCHESVTIIIRSLWHDNNIPLVIVRTVCFCVTKIDSFTDHKNVTMLFAESGSGFSVVTNGKIGPNTKYFWFFEYFMNTELPYGITDNVQFMKKE